MKCPRWLAGALLLAGPVDAQTLPDKPHCAAAIGQAESAGKSLPAGSMARRFADADLVQARAEQGNGEYDDCLEFAGKALDEAQHTRHSRAVPARPKHPA